MITRWIRDLPLPLREGAGRGVAHAPVPPYFYSQSAIVYRGDPSPNPSLKGRGMT